MKTPHIKALIGQGSPAWAIVSQGCNSASNVALGIVVARASTPEEFGAWSITYLVFIVAIGLSRAGTGTLLLLARAEQTTTSPLTGAVSLAAWAGAVTGLALIALGLVLPDLQAGVLAFAPFMPLLLACDTCRHHFFSRRDNRAAGLMDLAWLISQLALFAWLISAGTTGVVRYTVAWATTGAATACIALVYLRTLPRYSAARAFLRTNSSAITRLGIDQGLMSARTQATPLAVASTAGYAPAGSLRAGLTLMGLINALVQGLTPVYTVTMVRKVAGQASGTALVRTWSMYIFTASAINGTLLLLLPQTWGEQLLGQNWASARSILLPLVLHSLVRGPISGVPMLLRAREQFSLAVKLRMRVEPVALAVPVMGGIIWGAQGAAWGLFGGGLITSIQAIVMLRTSNRLAAT